MDKSPNASARRSARIAAATIGLLLLAGGATADPPPAAEPTQSSPSRARDAGLDTITVEGRRQREAIKREVNTFVTAITIPSFEESVARWQRGEAAELEQVG